MKTDLDHIREKANLRILYGYRKKLRKLLDDFKKGHFSLLATTQICMYSRNLAAEYAHRWIIGHDQLGSEEKYEIETDLRGAVDAVNRFRVSGSREILNLDKLLRDYLGNESARASRIRALNRGGLEVFVRKAEEQRFGIVRLRSKEDQEPDLEKRTTEIPPSGDALTGAVKDQATPMQTFRAVWLVALAKWMELFYSEMNQLLLEIQLEAGPYQESAKQQAILAQRILSRSKAVLPTDLPEQCDHNDRELWRRVLAASEEFRRLIAEPLKAAAKSAETEAKRVFKEEITAHAEPLLKNTNKLRRDLLKERPGGVLALPSRPVLGSPPAPTEVSAEGWTKAEEGRFLKLANRYAMGQISSKERKELNALQTRRRQSLYPLTQEEQEAIASRKVLAEQQDRETEKLIGALRDFVNVHSASKNQEGSSEK